MSKIKYVETSPEKKTLMFDNFSEWIHFFENRILEIAELEKSDSNFNYFRDWKYERYRLNKDGTLRKKINPIWLHTREARAKALINAKKFRDTKRKQHEDKASKNYSRAIEVLQENNIDLKLLNINIKRR